MSFCGIKGVYISIDVGIKGSLGDNSIYFSV